MKLSEAPEYENYSFRNWFVTYITQKQIITKFKFNILNIHEKDYLELFFIKIYRIK